MNKPKPVKGPSRAINMRLKADLANQLDVATSATGCAQTELIDLCIRETLDSVVEAILEERRKAEAVWKKGH